MTKGKRAGDGPIAVEVEKDKSSIGVLVDYQKNNHFATGHTEKLSLDLFLIKLKKLKKNFFVHVNKQTVSLFVMVHTTKSNIEIKNILTTFRL